MRPGRALKIGYLLVGLALIWKIQLGTKFMESNILYYYLLALQAFPIGFLLAFLPHAIHYFNVSMTIASRLTDFLTLLLGFLQWFYFFPWLSRRVDRWIDARERKSS